MDVLNVIFELTSRSVKVFWQFGHMKDARFELSLSSDSIFSCILWSLYFSPLKTVIKPASGPVYGRSTKFCLVEINGFLDNINNRSIIYMIIIVLGCRHFPRLWIRLTVLNDNKIHLVAIASVNITDKAANLLGVGSTRTFALRIFSIFRFVKIALSCF